MNCDQVQERVSEYLEGLLDLGDYQAVQDHLSRCARCHTEVESLSRTIRAVTNLPPLEPPPGFSRKVMAHIREKAERPGIWERLFFPVRIKIPIHAVALLLVSGLALYLYQANKPIQTEIYKSIPLESESPFREDILEKENAARQEPSVPPGLSKEEPKADTADTKGASKPGLSLRQDSIRLQSDVKITNGEAKIEAFKEERVTSSSPSEQEKIATEGIAPAPMDIGASKPDQTVYYELSLIPKEPVEGMEVLAQKLENLVKKVAGEYIQNKKEKDILKRSLLLEPETLWLIIPEDRYEQFKVELASLGKIESESKQSVLMPPTAGKKSSFVSDDKTTSLLQIKLTVLLPKRPEEALPTDQPAR